MTMTKIRVAATLGSSAADRLEQKTKMYLRELANRPGGTAIPARGVTLSPADAAAMPPADLLAVIDFHTISTNMRHNRHEQLHDPACSAHIMVAARTFGLAPANRPRATIADLAKSVRSHADFATLEGALAFVTSIVKCSLSTPIAVVFTPTIEQALDVMTRRDGKVLPQSMQELFDIAREIQTNSALPADFASALTALMQAKGWTAQRVARVAGVDPGTVRQWCRGSEPRSHQRSICVAIETALNVPPGTLLSRMSTTAIRMDSCSVLTDEVRDEFDAHSIPIRALGDDWNAIGVDEKRWRLTVLQKKTLSVPYRLSANKAHLDPLPPFANAAFKAQFEELVAYKTQTSGDCLDDCLDDEPVYKDPNSKHPWLKHGGYWDGTTAVLQKNNAERLIRAFRATLEPDQQAQLDAQGLGILTNARAVKAMMQADAKRRCDRLIRADFFKMQHMPVPKNGRIYTNGDVSRLIVIAGYLNQHTGYLFKNPPEVKVLRGFIDQDWIDKAKADWPTTAKSERADMIKAARRMVGDVQKVRDPWLPIAPLLDLNAPLEPVYGALARMAKDRPPFAASPAAMARHDRDICLLRLWAHTRLRRSCLVALTYRDDNTGMLRWRRDGGAVLVIPQEHFKNAGSSALPSNGEPVEIPIVPEQKALLRALRRWVMGEGNARSLLCDDKDNAYLFPGLGSGGLTPGSVHRICMAFSTLYLVDLPWRPGGIPGVLPFGSHAMRDLTCTQMIKITGRIADAADAVLDTETTMRKAYTRITSSEKNLRASEILRLSLPAGIDDEEGED